MAPFDPYHKWLGIPPRDQPPDHYRLLGLVRFEPDADVIASAADARMGHVRSLQSGQHAELTQRILNELAAARVCLLHPGKKAEYDAALVGQAFQPDAGLGQAFQPDAGFLLVPKLRLGNPGSPAVRVPKPELRSEVRSRAPRRFTTSTASIASRSLPGRESTTSGAACGSGSWCKAPRN